MSDVLRISTDLVEPDQRTDLWRELHRPFFDTRPNVLTSGNALEGALSTRVLGAMLVGEATFNTQRYGRDRQIIRQSGLEDFYLVQLLQGGAASRADCEGRALSANAGDIYVLDMARGFTGQVEAGRTCSVVLPRSRLDRIANGHDLHGVVLRAGSPIVRLLGNFLLGLPDIAGKVTRDEALAIEDATVALLTSALTRHAPPASLGDPPALSHILRRRVLEFIDANLGKPDLGPAMLMRHFRVSRAHLYRMFAAEGGVATIVRKKRLDAAYRDILRSSGLQRSVAQLAHDLGFSGRDQFQRAFRAQFGMTPSEARENPDVISLADDRLAGTHAHFLRIVKLHEKTEL